MSLLIESCCSVAFYCQRCGSIHIHDVPYFTGARETKIRCDSCGHEQGRIVRLSGSRFSIELSCVSCGTMNRVTYTTKHAHRVGLEKIFCSADHFELGYIGKRKRIEELMAFNQAEFEAIHPNDGKNFIEKQHILLEALNRVHDLAARGAITCPCGSDALAADIHGNSIVLECEHCGSEYVLSASSAEDLEKIQKDMAISLIAPGSFGAI